MSTDRNKMICKNCGHSFDCHLANYGCGIIWRDKKGEPNRCDCSGFKQSLKKGD